MKYLRIRQTHAVLFLLFVSTLLLAGCSSVPMTAIKSGKLATQGTIIKAEDGSFTIRAGEIFTPPYQNSQFYVQNPEGGYSFAGDVKSDFQASRKYIFQRSLVGQFDRALEAGAKPVRISTPYYKDELYGLLFFGMGVGVNTDLASRSYMMQIPRKYVEKAINGRVSVVYEQQNTGLKLGKVPTWIVWMSDQRFF